LHTGRLSIFVTNFMQESDTLYRNDGAAGFTDISVPSGITKATFTDVGWGTGFEDFTNSGWDDLFAANGHIYPNIGQAQIGVHYREPILLFQNNRDGTFRNVEPLTDLSKLPLESRRGVAFGDVNNDGKVDILMLNIDGPPTLLLNCTHNSNDAVLLHLVGTKSNRDGIGARVTVTAQGLKQLQEVRSGGSYLSQNDLRLHFGLGHYSKIDTIEIEWPSGEKQTLHNLAANRIYKIVEGKGVTRSVRFEKSAGCGSSHAAAK
jgi:enediyne biosynthesis protein E4